MRRISSACLRGITRRQAPSTPPRRRLPGHSGRSLHPANAASSPLTGARPGRQAKTRRGHENVRKRVLIGGRSCGCATTSASAPTPRGGRLLGYADHSDLEVFVRLGMTAGGGHRARHVTGRAGVRADREREHRGGAKPLTSWRSTTSCTRGRSPQGGLRQHRPITSVTGNSSFVFLPGSSPLDCRPGSPSTREPRSSGLSSRPTALLHHRPRPQILAEMARRLGGLIINDRVPLSVPDGEGEVRHRTSS